MNCVFEPIIAWFLVFNSLTPYQMISAALSLMQLVVTSWLSWKVLILTRRDIEDSQITMNIKSPPGKADTDEKKEGRIKTESYSLEPLELEFENEGNGDGLITRIRAKDDLGNRDDTGMTNQARRENKNIEILDDRKLPVNLSPGEKHQVSVVMKDPDNQEEVVVEFESTGENGGTPKVIRL